MFNSIRSITTSSPYSPSFLPISSNKENQHPHNDGDELQLISDLDCDTWNTPRNTLNNNNNTKNNVLVHSNDKHHANNQLSPNKQHVTGIDLISDQSYDALCSSYISSLQEKDETKIPLMDFFTHDININSRHSHPTNNALTSSNSNAHLATNNNWGKSKNLSNSIVNGNINIKRNVSSSSTINNTTSSSSVAFSTTPSVVDIVYGNTNNNMPQADSPVQDTQKRAKAPHMQEGDDTWLVQLVFKHLPKGSDEWDVLTAAFNKTQIVHRTATQLRKRWTCLVRKARGGKNKPNGSHKRSAFLHQVLCVETRLQSSYNGSDIGKKTPQEDQRELEQSLDYHLDEDQMVWDEEEEDEVEEIVHEDEFQNNINNNDVSSSSNINSTISDLGSTKRKIDMSLDINNTVNGKVRQVLIKPQGVGGGGGGNNKKNTGNTASAGNTKYLSSNTSLPSMRSESNQRKRLKLEDVVIQYFESERLKNESNKNNNVAEQLNDMQKHIQRLTDLLLAKSNAPSHGPDLL